MFFVVLAAIVLALSIWLVISVRSRSKAARKPTVIRLGAIRWGIANLRGEDARGIMEEDVSALRPVLGTPKIVARGVPSCNVLFLYARIEAKGTISGWSSGLREVIRDSGAVVVVVACDNSPDNYIAASPRKSYGQSNLVMVLKRNDPHFQRFFVHLFSSMRRGVPMPVAWNELAPQHPGAAHEPGPDAIFACEVGDVVFPAEIAASFR